MNFEPSRSEERGMTNLQRKPGELRLFGNGKNVESDGSSSEIKDVSVFLDSGRTCSLLLYHVVSTSPHWHSSLSLSRDVEGEKFGFRLTLGRQSCQELQPLTHCVPTSGSGKKSASRFDTGLVMVAHILL